MNGLRTSDRMRSLLTRVLRFLCVLRFLPLGELLDQVRPERRVLGHASDLTALREKLLRLNLRLLLQQREVDGIARRHGRLRVQLAIHPGGPRRNPRPHRLHVRREPAGAG